MSKTDAMYVFAANSSYDQPCLICGATKRNEKGQDPCIPDLPGVLHACCGHGRGPGYTAFENGYLIRGYFQFNEPERQTFIESNKEWLLADAEEAARLAAARALRHQGHKVDLRSSRYINQKWGPSCDIS